MSTIDSRASTYFSPSSVLGDSAYPNSPKVMWINPISMAKLKRAVSRKSPTVEMNGVIFNITYGIYLDLPMTGERREVVKLKRADGGYAPFGYVSVARIMRSEFEADDQ